MSGVEIAGFVLAAFPICISALEHYRESAEVLGQFWQIRREYKKWTHNLNICRLGFEQNLEEFLLPLIADEDELQQLIASPSGPQWKNPELETRLRQRLPKSYDLYLESIDHIKDVMNHLKHELGIDRTGFQSKLSEDDNKPRDKFSKMSLDTLVSKANLEYQTQRIRMSFNQSKRDKLFDELTNYNNELRALLDTSDRIAALRHSRGVAKKSALSKELWQFWRHADKLYSLLTQSWRCECKSFHQANLLLQHRTTSRADFKIMFVFAQQNFRAKPWPWTWQETNIKMLEDEWLPIKSSVSFTAITPTVSTESISSHTPSQASSAVAPSKEKKSSFRNSIMRKFKADKIHKSPLPCNPPSGQSTPPPVPVPLIVATPPETLRVTFTDTSKSASNKDQVDMIDISNLCDTIAAYRSNLTRLGCLKDEEYRFSISPSQSHGTMADIQDTVSLDLLLKKDSKIKLTRRQRYFIALTLASSHMQLHSTPWISSHWTKKDILFLRDSTNPNKVPLNQPYISRNFALIPKSHGNSDDRSLSNLGIMLLELCFGIALEDHEIRQKYSSCEQAPNPYLDLAAALEWCPRAVEEAGPEFADAILWCLYNMPGSGEACRNLERRREELFVKVVEPLQYCYNQFSAVGA